MKTSGDQNLANKFKLPVVEALFFCAIFAYILLVIEPFLIYHNPALPSGFPTFFAGTTFFSEFVSVPGGLIEYTSAFIAQGYHSSWLGSLIIAGISMMICVGLRMLIRLTIGRKSYFVCYLPILIIIAMYGQYYHAINTCVSVLAAVWMGVLYWALAKEMPKMDHVLFALIFAAGYYVFAGHGIALLMIAISVDCIVHGRWKAALVKVAIAISIVYIVGVYLCQLELSAAFLRSTPIAIDKLQTVPLNTAVILEIVLFAFSPVAITALAILSRITSQTAKRGKLKARSPRLPMIKQAVAATLIIIIAVGCHFFTFESNRKSHCKAAYLVLEKDWAMLLDHVRQIPPSGYNFFFNHCVNRAMYHEGLLGEKMFSWPQIPGALLAPPNNSRHYLWQLLEMDINMALGNLNSAQSRGINAMEATNYGPVVLYKLGLINIAKGQTDAARVLLNLLSKDLVFGEKAESILREIDGSSELPANSEIALLKDNRWQSNHAVIAYDYEFMLVDMLRENPENRMAFEYLMATYLLNKQLGKISENIYRLEEFGYKRIPTHYQQALVIYNGTSGKKTDLGKYKLDKEILQASGIFSNTLNRFKGNKSQAFKALAKDFSTSYYFYYVFDRSGAAR